MFSGALLWEMCSQSLYKLNHTSLSNFMFTYHLKICFASPIAILIRLIWLWGSLSKKRDMPPHRYCRECKRHVPFWGSFDKECSQTGLSMAAGGNKSRASKVTAWKRSACFYVCILAHWSESVMGPYGFEAWENGVNNLFLLYIHALLCFGHHVHLGNVKVLKCWCCHSMSRYFFSYHGLSPTSGELNFMYH